MTQQTNTKIDWDGGIRTSIPTDQQLVGKDTAILRTTNLDKFIAHAANNFHLEISTLPHNIAIFEETAERKKRLANIFSRVKEDVTIGADILCKKAYLKNLPWFDPLEKDVEDELKNMAEIFYKATAIEELKISIIFDLERGIHNHEPSIMNRVLEDSGTGYWHEKDKPDNAGTGNVLFFPGGFPHETTSREAPLGPQRRRITIGIHAADHLPNPLSQ